MRILVLGGDGMLGHQVCLTLAQRHEVRSTLRRSSSFYAPLTMFESANTFFDTDVRDLEAVTAILDAYHPDAVINCVGIVKQRDESQDRRISIEINALAPHRIADVCAERQIRFVHVSTDCVFDGRRGAYKETDVCNVSDNYGLTKYLGEVSAENAITLRTSIIGHELARKSGLLEWFLAQEAEIDGYSNAVFSGLTTLELANVMDKLLTRFPAASGLYHVASMPISKYELLQLVNEVYEKNVTIRPDETYQCDRSLVADRFNTEFEYSPPDWPTLVAAMRTDYEGRLSNA